MRHFVIAMEDEADCVRPFMHAGDRLTVCGIGKVNAAAGATKAICEGADEIFNVGFSGGFGDDVRVGNIYGVARAVEYDFDLAEINGTAIGVLDECETPYLDLAQPEDFARFAWFGGWRILATGDRFNDSEDDYDLITKTLGASLRDMEGAAIAHVCKKHAVRCVSLKCVTNVAGQGSMTSQFAENRKFCFERLRKAMKEAL